MRKKSKFILSCVTLCISIVLGIFMYNYFELWRYKNLYKQGILIEIFKTKFSNQKCEFNQLAQNGGGNRSNLSHNCDFFIAHAGGGLIQDEQILPYTNSKEALLQSINEGFKFIELDLMLDNEGGIFAAHSYEDFYKFTNAPLSQDIHTPPSKDYIKNARILGHFSPLSADDINEIFLKNPNLYLVTDKITDFKALKTQFNFTNRIIVEVFSKIDYFKAKKLGFKPALCVWSSVENLKSAMKLKIPMITASTFILRDENGVNLTQKYIQNGGCILMFSSNQKDFIDKFKGKNATMFYTDFYNINANKCKLNKEKCETY